MSENAKNPMEVMAPTHVPGLIKDHTENNQDSIIERGTWSSDQE